MRYAASPLFTSEPPYKSSAERHQPGVFVDEHALDIRRVEVEGVKHVDPVCFECFERAVSFKYSRSVCLLLSRGTTNVYCVHCFLVIGNKKKLHNGKRLHDTVYDFANLLTLQR